MVGQASDVAIDGPRLLYDGPLRLSFDGDAELGEGYIYFDWDPSPTVAFRFWIRESSASSAFALFGRTGDGDVELAGEAPLRDPFLEARFEPPTPPDDVRFSTGGIIPNQNIGNPRGVRSLRIGLVNFVDWRLPASRDGEHLAMAVDCWSIDVSAALPEPDRKAVPAGGYAITHWLTIERADGQPFDAADGLDHLRAALWHALGFINGSITGFVMPTGRDAAGEVVFLEWSRTIVSPRRGRINWCDPSCAQSLQQLLRGWFDKTTDDFWRQVLARTTRFILNANAPDPVDVSVVSAFAALELLSWAVLTVEQDWLRLQEAEAMSAESKIRLLLRWASVPTELPARLEALKTFAGGGADVDGPAAIARVRNRIVHPPRKRDGLWPSGEQVIQAWQLTLEYAELVVLRVVGSEGNFGTRIYEGGRWEGETQRVPWAPDA